MPEGAAAGLNLGPGRPSKVKKKKKDIKPCAKEQAEEDVETVEGVKAKTKAKPHRCIHHALWHTAIPPHTSNIYALHSDTSDPPQLAISKSHSAPTTDTRTFQAFSSTSTSASEASFLSKVIQSGMLSYRDSPLVQPDVTDEMFVVYFEDWLKNCFFSILQIFETFSLDPLLYIRTQAPTLIFTLFRDNPKQNRTCSGCSSTNSSTRRRTPSLSMRSMRLCFVPPVSSAAVSLVSSLPTSTQPTKRNRHIRFTDDAAPNSTPKPKRKAAPATTAAMEKKNANTHARYYTAITFNQIVLTPALGDREVALKLIKMYFEKFKEILGEGSNHTTDNGDGDHWMWGRRHWRRMWGRRHWRRMWGAGGSKGQGCGEG
ncbi:hypothetical protein H0H92_005662 [Tricholoma furcatifolium]|nr:hypothetical protein H0H92_005662 [Tricholoma furcatifolium]